MRRCRAGWTLSVRILAGMRSRQSNLQRLIRKAASFALPPFLRIRPANGSPQNGRYARSRIFLRRSGWEPPSLMRGGMPFSRWWALPEKMISMHRISVPMLMLQRSDHDPRIIGSDRMGKKLPGNLLRRVAVETSGDLQQDPFSEYNYQQAFAKA